jgi:hypothetical protein
MLDTEADKDYRSLDAIKVDEADLQNAAMVQHLMATLIHHMNLSQYQLTHISFLVI